MASLRQVFSNFIELSISVRFERTSLAHGTPRELGLRCAFLAEQVLAITTHDNFTSGA